MDYILNGQARGSVASLLLNTGFNPASLRPYIGKDGRTYISVAKDGKLVAHSTQVTNGTLRYDEWRRIDEAVMRVARPRLNIVNELRSRSLVMNLTNAMGTTVFSSERMSDITGATISMDPTRKGESDRPEYDMVNLPLPVIHKDFFINARQLAVSRNGSTPLDTTMAELAGRKVAEEAEKLALGTSGSFAYGGGTIYGLTNFPDRVTAVLTDPRVTNWTPTTLVSEILEMRQSALNRYQFGPYALYFSPGWDQYLDEDYNSTSGVTLRQRISAISNIASVGTADYLSDYQVILIQLSTDVVREIVGMDITTVQWESEGGLQLNFKVMAILVPQLRSDQNGNTGIVHGTTA